jgi:DNA-binding beta-propeller fold protein YncE
LGKLGANFTTTGATWSQDDKILYAINGADDTLYTINTKTGVATAITELNYDFGTVGIEVHPANNTLYSCSTAGDLLEVDPATGNVTVIGPMGQGTSCTNLAAPWLDVECIALP